MLLMQHDMRNVYRGGANVFELLLQLEEAILDLFLDVLWQGLLSAYQLGVTWVSLVLHESATCRAHRCVELLLIDTSVRHWLWVELVDLGLLLKIDAVDCGASGVHLLLHALGSAPECIGGLWEAVHVRLGLELVLVDVLLLKADFLVEVLLIVMAKFAHGGLHESLILRHFHGIVQIWCRSERVVHTSHISWNLRPGANCRISQRL